jgi:hypothetical protein
MKKKIVSVMELAKYKIGDLAYHVMLQPTGKIPRLASADKWMREVHPKVLYSSGPFKHLWKYTSVLPRVSWNDFEDLIMVITASVEVQPFCVKGIERCKHTGEFIYTNEDDVEIPESCLFDTKQAASLERSRILKLFKKWVEVQT